MKKFISILFFSLICMGFANAQKFDTHKIHFTAAGLMSRNVNIRPIGSFSIKKDDRHSWAEYIINQNEITFSVSANNTKNSRSCIFVLLNASGKAVDTLTVIQAGKVEPQTTGSTNTERNSVIGTTSQRKNTTSSSQSTVSRQCAATTKKGKRCSRNADAGSIYCWQHK